MFGQMTAGGWIYIGTQGILQGTYQTFAAAGEKHFGVGGPQPGDDPDCGARGDGRRAAAGRDDGGRRDPLRRGRPGADPAPAGRATSTRSPTRSRTASRECGRPPAEGAGPVGRRRGNAAEIVPELVTARRPFDLVTDQTAAHDPLTGYVPIGLSSRSGFVCALPNRSTYPAGARLDREARRGLVDTSAPGATSSTMETTCAGRPMSGSRGSLLIPGLRPGLYPAALLPWRRCLPLAALSGDRVTSPPSTTELRRLFPDDVLCAGSSLLPSVSPSRDCPPGSAGLGYGDRAKAGLMINQLVRAGSVSAPVVIGRDHLDSGSVASPYRETEAMRDGSDAIADWPILNALLNTAAGATWVSVHHGGGVGIGNSIHAGMVVAGRRQRRRGRAARAGADDRPGDGRDAARRRRLRRSARRRARARPRPAERQLTVPKLLVRDLAQVVSPAGRGAPLRGAALREVELARATPTCSATAARSPRSAR